MACNRVLAPWSVLGLVWLLSCFNVLKPDSASSSFPCPSVDAMAESPISSESRFSHSEEDHHLLGEKRPYREADIGSITEDGLLYSSLRKDRSSQYGCSKWIWLHITVLTLYSEIFAVAMAWGLPWRKTIVCQDSDELSKRLCAWIRFRV
jgi:hypothetical protein